MENTKLEKERYKMKFVKDEEIQKVLELHETKIKLSEPPHIVIQGEGELMGTKMLLIRLHGCNVKCDGCDSFHTWDEKRLSTTIQEYRVVELAKILNNILVKNELTWLMVTGGEPQLWRKEILELYNQMKILRLQNKKHLPKLKLEIETTGMMDWSMFEEIDNSIHFDLSPKIGSLFNSKMKKEINYKFFETLGTIGNDLMFLPQWNIKIVCSKKNWKNDLQAIKDFQKKYKIPNDKIYLMPFGTTEEVIKEESKFLIEKAVKYKFNFSPRLHILIYGDKRLV